MMAKRMARELGLLSRSPPPGIAAWMKEEGRVDVLEAEISGAKGTPYEGGIFRLEVGIPPEYPLQPPRVRFVTRIYHPNIDDAGRICLDTLNMPPKGAWKPSLNIATMLASVQLLMAEPNPDDGLMVDITEEYKTSRETFEAKARALTAKHAKGGASVVENENDVDAKQDLKKQEAEEQGEKAEVHDASVELDEITPAIPQKRLAAGTKMPAKNSAVEEIVIDSEHESGRPTNDSYKMQTKLQDQPRPKITRLKRRRLSRR